MLKWVSFPCRCQYCSTCITWLRLGLLCLPWATTPCSLTTTGTRYQSTLAEDFVFHFQQMIPSSFTSPRWAVHLGKTLTGSFIQCIHQGTATSLFRTYVFGMLGSNSVLTDCNLIFAALTTAAFNACLLTCTTVNVLEFFTHLSNFAFVLLHLAS